MAPDLGPLFLLLLIHPEFGCRASAPAPREVSAEQANAAGRLTNDQRAVHGWSNMIKYYTDRGDAKAVANAGAAMLMHSKRVSQQAGAFALAAIKKVITGLPPRPFRSPTTLSRMVRPFASTRLGRAASSTRWSATKVSAKTARSPPKNSRTWRLACSTARSGSSTRHSSLRCLAKARRSRPRPSLPFQGCGYSVAS